MIAVGNLKIVTVCEKKSIAYNIIRLYKMILQGQQYVECVTSTKPHHLQIGFQKKEVCSGNNASFAQFFYLSLQLPPDLARVRVRNYTIIPFPRPLPL